MLGTKVQNINEHNRIPMRAIRDVVTVMPQLLVG
jgi:hypothetical protein